MRKDVKLVLAFASLLLVGLLGYLLFAPSHKKTAQLTDATETTSESAAATPNESITPAPAVNVSLAPATEPTTAPAVTVSLAPATQPSTATIVTGPAAIVPAVDSNVAVTTTGGTDWSKTLNTGAVATATTSSHAGSFSPSSTLIASTDTSASTPATHSLIQTTAAGGKTHKVAQGETLSSIAAEYYGTKASYTKIIAANPGLNPNHLKIGTVLTIPDLKADIADATTASSSTASAGTYAVKPGDSLQKIATKLYGSSEKWEKIYDLNRSAIGGDPHRLKAGMVIKLPETPSTSAVH